MKGLAKLFVAAGCAEVRTYIQSGNVVFRASDAAAARIGAAVTAAIEKRFGLAVPVVVRSAAELREVVRNNPFIGKGDDGALFVSFLADRPDRGKVASLDPKRSPPDQFLVRGGEVYLKAAEWRREDEAHQRLFRFQALDDQHRAQLAHDPHIDGNGDGGVIVGSRRVVGPRAWPPPAKLTIGAMR